MCQCINLKCISKWQQKWNTFQKFSYEYLCSLLYHYLMWIRIEKSWRYNVLRIEWRILKCKWCSKPTLCKVANSTQYNCHFKFYLKITGEIREMLSKEELCIFWGGEIIRYRMFFNHVYPFSFPFTLISLHIWSNVHKYFIVLVQNTLPLLFSLFF